jgi:CRISPR-associated protein Csm2
MGGIVKSEIKLSLNSQLTYLKSEIQFSILNSQFSIKLTMNKPTPPQPRPNNSQAGIVKVSPTSPNRESREPTIDRIKKLTNFSDYNIRELVVDAEELGKKLKAGGLETNQVRKFLDAINRIKADLLDEIATDNKDDERFKKIEVDIVLLKPKLAYATARKSEVEPLQKVLDVAIDRVRSLDDFKRLVQFVESIIAYHKAAEGK